MLPLLILHELLGRILDIAYDNHLFLVDLTNKNITGKDAAMALDMAGITVNKNLIPFDKLFPSVTKPGSFGTVTV